ncbi:MAG: twin-arginine translocase subunit TatC [Candidatus Thermoplasmatota archaeon]
MDAGQALRAASVAAVALLLVALGVALAASSRRQTGTMALLDHVADLRRRLLVSVAAVLAGVLVSLGIGLDWVGGWPVPRLALYDSVSSQLFRAVAADLVPANVQLVVTTPMDGFSAQFAWSLALGLLLGMPIVLWQMGGFFAPALQPREARTLRGAILPSVLLFVAGALFAYLAVVPTALEALYGFSAALGAAPLLEVGSFSTFVLGFLVGFGFAFQTPIVMVALSRTGLVAPATWRKGWRQATVILLIAAGMLTPDPTVVSQLLLAGPLLGLYALGAILARGPKPV